MCYAYVNGHRFYLNTTVKVSYRGALATRRHYAK